MFTLTGFFPFFLSLEVPDQQSLRIEAQTLHNEIFNYHVPVLQWMIRGYFSYNAMSVARGLTCVLTRCKPIDTG
jgi:hypothetical protein